MEINDRIQNRFLQWKDNLWRLLLRYFETLSYLNAISTIFFLKIMLISGLRGVQIVPPGSGLLPENKKNGDPVKVLQPIYSNIRQNSHFQSIRTTLPHLLLQSIQSYINKNVNTKYVVVSFSIQFIEMCSDYFIKRRPSPNFGSVKLDS